MKRNQELINALDEILFKIDEIISGRSNIIYKTDLNPLRNFIVELQEKCEN